MRLPCNAPLAAAVLIVVGAASVPVVAAKPNIVLILADDMGWGDPTCYNRESKIPTPNLDRIAARVEPRFARIRPANRCHS